MSCKFYNNKYIIASAQITNTEIFAFVAPPVFKLLSRKVLHFIDIAQIRLESMVLNESKFLIEKRAYFSSKFRKKIHLSWPLWAKILISTRFYIKMKGAYQKSHEEIYTAVLGG